jgi:hypothetical protein
MFNLTIKAMKNFYLLALFLLNFASANTQNIVYTVSATRDGNSSALDSILFENLENKSRFMVGDLPDLQYYEIDLNSQMLITAVVPVVIAPSMTFNLVKNIPGEAGIQLSGNSLENTTVNIFNVSGQKVYSRAYPVINPYDVITVSVPLPGVYILNVVSSPGVFNFRIIGSVGNTDGGFLSSVSTAHDNPPVPEVAPAPRSLKITSHDAGFSFQTGDSIRVTAFLGGCYTHPHGSRVADSRSVSFTMLESTAEETGISDRYKYVADEDYTILEYDQAAGKTRFQLLSDNIELLRGDIITLNLDTLGLIQRVLNSKEVDGKIIVETEPGYMDELFVNASFKLDTRMVEPKKSLKSTSTPQEILEALTDENGLIHPVKIIYHDSHDKRIMKSVLDDDFTRNDRTSIISFHENLSGTDLYGKQGDNIHFYIDQGYVSLTADAIFEFDFKYNGKLSEDTKVKKSDLEFFKFYLDAEAGFQSRLALDMDESGEGHKNERLCSGNRATAIFYVPPAIPVWVIFNCDIHSDYHFNADASLNASWGFESTHSVQEGGTYEKSTDGFTTINRFTPVNTVYPLTIEGEGEVNANSRFELYPRTDIRFYDFCGPFAEIAPFVEGNYNAALQGEDDAGEPETFLAWNSELDLGLDLRLGTSLRFILELFNKDCGPDVINCFSSPVWESPFDIELLTQLPKETEVDQTFEVQIKVSDHTGLPVSLCPVFFTGDGIFSKQVPVTGTDGILTVNWEPGNTPGIKQFTSSICKADKTVIKSVTGSTDLQGNWPRDTYTQVVDVINPATGKTWMDRNLGASRAATSSTDKEAYGDYYQWGRGADGHQLRSSPTSIEQSTSNTPGHGKFVITRFDWRSPQNQNLWQGVDGINNPCPEGYRLPTAAEFEAERESWSTSNGAGAMESPLKIPLAGWRDLRDGTFGGVNFAGEIWSSTVDALLSKYLTVRTTSSSMVTDWRTWGLSVRCIKDDASD